MATTKPEQNGANGQPALEEWLGRLNALIASIKQWATVLDWSTREISKRIDDSRLGQYTAPALVMQKESARVLVDPIARFAPGAEGVVDLYLMPAYDDVATLLFIDGRWRIRYLFHAEGRNLPQTDEESQPLTKETLAQALDEMIAHAGKSV